MRPIPPSAFAAPPLISRRERKKRDTRKRILDAALALMADRPYELVRIEDICAAADVANATFFLHFPNKSALAMAYNEAVAAKVGETLAASRESATRRLEILLEVYLQEWGAHRHLMRQIVLEMLSQPGAGAAFNEVSPGLLGLVADIVTAGQKNGEFSRAVPAQIAALALVAAWNAIAVTWARTGDTEQAALAHWQTLELFLRGLQARDRLSQSDSSVGKP